MSICRKVKIDFDYSIDNIILSRVTEFNDLGITITSKFSWCENVKTVSSKAHSMVGMIKRSVGFNSPIDVKRQLYLAHVRSILEYCSPMWSPNHVKDIIKLERAATPSFKIHSQWLCFTLSRKMHSIIYLAFVLPSRNNRLVFFIQLPSR